LVNRQATVITLIDRAVAALEAGFRGRTFIRLADVVATLRAVAEAERARRSERTRVALQAARARGVRLGNPDLAEARARGVAASAARVAAFRAEILPEIAAIRSAGTPSLRGIARELNRRGIAGPNGGVWHAQSVKNALKE
jgi:DNA invertase Pin-like site-specific DNA recombinase